MDNEALPTEGTEMGAEPEVGEREQDVAEPATETKAGEREQDVAEPAETTDEGTQEQTPEERHAQAEARRLRQSKERERELREEYEAKFQAQKDAFYADLKKVNPYTNKPITTEAEYLEYVAETHRRDREQEFKKAGINPETIEQMINEHPDVKAAKEAAEEAKRAKARFDKLSEQQAIKAEIEKISRIDPNVKTADDLMHHPQYTEIKQLVSEHNHSIAEAFELATRKTREAKIQARSRDSAAAVQNSKSHMVATKSSGSMAEEYTIPPETLRAYRKAYPSLSDSELRKKYAKVQKIKKGK